MNLNFNASIAQRIAYGALAAGVLLMALAACALLAWIPAGLSAASQSRDATTFWPDTFQIVSQASSACGGWLLVFAGLLLLGQQAARGRMVDALRQLQEDEHSQDQGLAKSQISEAASRLSPDSNTYTAARQYLTKLRSQKDPGKHGALDQARRRLAHFWYRAAKLVELGVLSEDEVLDSLDPSILMSLEPFETIVAEDTRDLTQPRPWPAMRFYIAWLRRKGEQQKAAEWQATLPARPKLYAESRPGDDKHDTQTTTTR